MGTGIDKITNLTASFFIDSYSQISTCSQDLQFMAFLRTASNAEEEESAVTGHTVIAIDKDRNSLLAVKWTVDHLLKKNSSSSSSSCSCTLVHVLTNNTLHCNDGHDVDSVSKQCRPPTEEELHQFFLPFRGFCARKGIVAKELVLHDKDVASALTDYIMDNSISNIVVGASHCNALISCASYKKFKDADVPASLVRSVPESCTVHVISKGKVQNIRPTGQRQSASIMTTKSINLKGNSALEDINRKSVKYGIWGGSSNGRVLFGQNNDAVQVAQYEETNSPKLPEEGSSSHNSSNQSSSITGTRGLLESQWTEMSHENQEVVVNSNNSTSTSYSESPRSLEIQIKKLKLELKRTTEKYSTACREAVVAKQKAMELVEVWQEDEQNLEKARLAEEAALALGEVERQKIKTARESAEIAQRLAEMETQKRKQAEMRDMHEEEERKSELNAITHDNIPCRRYNIKEIEVATHYFDNALKIGEGAYGHVFKGVLDHTVVAIKVLKPDIVHGERQFYQEVDVLSTIRHPNMVLLLGACPEYGCLVYEYMENGSLEDRLFQKDNTPPIPWKIRFKIASEIATGLHFLHLTKPKPLVHRDLKPANILLDEDYVSKITDVGLARLVPPSVANKTTQYHMTAAAGTLCYIDPEYQQTGLLGVKSDIYSLGVMLLQIITGKPPMGVAHLVEKAIQEGRFPEVLDPNVTDWPVEETLSYARLALKCCEFKKRDRPNLGSVILPELNRLRDLGGASHTDVVLTSDETS